MYLKKQIESYLKTQKLMALATYGDNPWIANVYYVHDAKLNLYFLSKSWREHCQAIRLNDQVAVAIADSSQPIYLPQKGLQLWGTAQPLKSVDKIKWMFKMWNKLIATKKGEYLSDPKKFLEAGNSTVFQISPKRIKFFNTELWPKEQYQVIEL